MIQNLKFIFVVVFTIFLFQPHTSNAQTRTGTTIFSPQTLSSINPNSLANAILTADTLQFLTNASFSGADNQAAVFSQNLQGFPTDSGSFLLLSSGVAAQAPGTASTFVSDIVGGGTGISPDGFNAFDVATLTLTLNVPNDAMSLLFDFTFGTEENPTFLNTGFQDFFTAKINNTTNIALLPNGDTVTVDHAVPFSNSVTGDSGAPTGELPSPNDVVYNAVLRDIQTASFNLVPFRGQSIAIAFQIGDASDSNLNSAVFLDNLRITRGAEQMIKPTIGGKIRQLFNDGALPGADPKRHWGIDIDGTIVGTTVFSAASGKIIRVVRTPDTSFPLNQFGKWVWISHENITKLDNTTVSNISSLYLHLDSINPSLVAGQIIPQGTPLGTVDSTGLVTGPHLHFGVRQGVAPDPSLATLPTGDLRNPADFVDYQLGPNLLSVTAKSPVDIVLTDPDGLIISKQVNQLSTTTSGYFEVKYLNGNPGNSSEHGHTDYDTIQIDERKNGDYRVTVVPEQGASSTAVYSLFIGAGTTTATLVENVRIADIPSQPYILRSASTGVEKIIPANIKIAPRTLNLGNKGLFSAIVEISKGFGASVKNIDLKSIKINGVPATRTIVSKDKFAIAFFDTQKLKNVAAGEKVELKITGKLKDGTTFEGKDSVRVIGRGKFSTSSFNQLASALIALQSALIQLLELLR